EAALGRRQNLVPAIGLKLGIGPAHDWNSPHPHTATQQIDVRRSKRE
ncbi:MAG: hypothetical protein QOI40_3602, partial [Alphaproteobacteria bacterium]|nr:hypothetical protein [Alphaproteobacteria bacterium]